MTTSWWAWKQPSFEESVIAHWSNSMTPKISRILLPLPRSAPDDAIAARSAAAIAAPELLIHLELKNSSFNRNISCI
ncbi:hypothetical protein QL285_018599 [Trifolium repens]|nr:hypothetical protein QL285_018599 [Trifolium repens]